MTSMHRLDINGMSCGACVASVERLAMGIEGVESVSVNLALERAVVTLQHATSSTRSSRPSIVVGSVHPDPWTPLSDGGKARPTSAAEDKAWPGRLWPRRPACC